MQEFKGLKYNSKFIMENDGIIGERKNLAPIMEEEDKRQAKGFLPISFPISCMALINSERERERERENHHRA